MGAGCGSDDGTRNKLRFLHQEVVDSLHDKVYEVRARKGVISRNFSKGNSNIKLRKIDQFYQGEMAKLNMVDVRNGYGVQVDKHGQMYEGEWENDEFMWGHFFDRTGKTYIG